MVNYMSRVPSGPTPGTPQPPEAPSSTGQIGGRPAGGGSSVAQTMQQWRQGIFTPPAQSATVGAPSAPSPAATGAGGVATSPLPRPPAPTPTSMASSAGAPPPISGQAGVVPGTQTTGTVMLPTVPTMEEATALPPGSYETPVGTLVVAQGQEPKVVLNPQGQQLYQERFAEALQRFGQHPFVNDPSAPPPPVRPGAPAFNPFPGGGWVGTDDTPQPPGA